MVVIVILQVVTSMLIVVVMVSLELFPFMTTFEKPLSATGWSQWLQVKQFGCQEVLKA